MLLFVRKVCAGAIALAALLAVGSLASADVLNLGDQNSTMTIDTGSNAGISQFTVDGVNRIQRGWFWYRLGNGSEASIDTLTQTSAFTLDLNPDDPRDDHASVSYSAAKFTITVDYDLAGNDAGSGTTSLLQSIQVTNTTSQALNGLQLFELWDFGVAGAPTDPVAFVDGNNVQLTPPAGQAVTGTLMTPAPTGWQIGSGASLLGLLTDGSATTLNDSTGPAGTNSAAAVQWSIDLAARGSFFVSQVDGAVQVPSPTIPLPAAAWSGLGMLGVLGATRARKMMRD